MSSPTSKYSSCILNAVSMDVAGVGAAFIKKVRKQRVDTSIPHSFDVVDSDGVLSYYPVAMMEGLMFRRRVHPLRHIGGATGAKPAKPNLYNQRCGTLLKSASDYDFFPNQMNMSLGLHLLRMGFYDCRLVVPPVELGYEREVLEVVLCDYDIETFEPYSREQIHAVLSPLAALGITVHPDAFQGESFVYRVPPSENLPQNGADFDVTTPKNYVRHVMTFLNGNVDYGTNQSRVDDARAAIIKLINFPTRASDQDSVAEASGEVEDLVPGHDITDPINRLIAILKEGSATLNVKADTFRKYEDLKVLSAAVSKLAVVSKRKVLYLYHKLCMPQKSHNDTEPHEL